jgi:hypothetical protein
MTQESWLPLRKVLVALATAAAIYIARLLGLHFASGNIQNAVNAFVPVLLAYLVKESKPPVAAPPSAAATTAGNVSATITLVEQVVGDALMRNPDQLAALERQLLTTLGTLGTSPAPEPASPTRSPQPGDQVA